MVLVVQCGIGRLLPSDDIGLDLFLDLLILTALRKLIVQVVGLIHIDQVVRPLHHMWRRVVFAVHLKMCPYPVNTLIVKVLVIDVA